MPLFEAGTTFLDFRSVNFQGAKTKYFIGMNNADYDDDYIVSFVFNTEHRMDLYRIGCNKEKQKFILEPKEFNFLKEYTSVMLSIPCYIQLKYIIDNERVKILDKASDNLARQIKNCLDMNNVAVKFQRLIKASFK